MPRRQCVASPFPRRLSPVSRCPRPPFSSAPFSIPSASFSLLATSLLLFLLLVAACTPYAGRGRGVDAERAKYYQGQQGVEIRIDQLPPKLYYYGNVPETSHNEFPFAVEAWNKGSAYSRGAVFISGYNPHIIEIEQIPITGLYPGACSLRLGDYSLNKFGITLQCGENFRWSGSEGNWFESLSLRGKTWFTESPLENLILNFNSRNGGEQIDLIFDSFRFSRDYRQRGLVLIAILAGLSFEKYLGQEFLLAGNTYEYPGGELDYIEYNARIVNWPEGADEIPQTFKATSCYMYTTFAAPVVCIDPQPYAETRKVCTPLQASYSSGQGAPVAVTRVTQENTPRTAVFHFTIRNVGDGTVFDAGQLEKCSPYFPGGAKSSDLNVVWIGSVRIDDTDLVCTPERYVRLQNGQGSFTCTYPIQHAQLNSAYQTPIVIELWYGYSKDVVRTIPIKRVA